MIHGHLAFWISQNMMLFKACMDVSLISFPSQASLDDLLFTPKMLSVQEAMMLID